jgi:hypothetical protein
MKKLALLFLWLGVLGCAVNDRAANVVPISFTGRFELTKDEGKAFALDVVQSGKEAKISFSAGNEDGSGAAPDGDGHGAINSKGELVFKFSDSFENTGSAVLRRSGNLFQLSMQLDKVEDPRATVHYGRLTLKRTSTKPPAQDR